jgi:hypothetical protein
MHLVSHRKRTSPHIAAGEVAHMQDNRDRQRQFEEISTLAERFNRAHRRLNEIELALHDGINTSDRVDLLHSLEDARVEYMDARFALSMTEMRKRA